MNTATLGDADTVVTEKPSLHWVRQPEGGDRLWQVAGQPETPQWLWAGHLPLYKYTSYTQSSKIPTGFTVAKQSWKVPDGSLRTASSG